MRHLTGLGAWDERGWKEGDGFGSEVGAGAGVTEWCRGRSGAAAGWFRRTLEWKVLGMGGASSSHASSMPREHMGADRGTKHRIEVAVQRDTTGTFRRPASSLVKSSIAGKGK